MDAIERAFFRERRCVRLSAVAIVASWFGALLAFGVIPHLPAPYQLYGIYAFAGFAGCIFIAAGFAILFAHSYLATGPSEEPELEFSQWLKSAALYGAFIAMLVLLFEPKWAMSMIALFTAISSAISARKSFARIW